MSNPHERLVFQRRFGPGRRSQLYRPRCRRLPAHNSKARRGSCYTPASVTRPLPSNPSPQLKQFIDAAVEQSKITTAYDPSYVGIDYPNGDVPVDTGVCSDVVIRAFRKVGLDLQKELHEDMTRAWGEYPKKWGARGTDTNIDHRRVLNLNTYFTRQGKSLPISDNRADYLPGDVVAWELSDGVEHIGILTNVATESDEHYLIVHNIRRAHRRRVAGVENHRTLSLLSVTSLDTKSGGKPTFLTLRLLTGSINFCLKAAPSDFATQLRSARGQEGGLAPALFVSVKVLCVGFICPDKSQNRLYHVLTDFIVVAAISTSEY